MDDWVALRDQAQEAYKDISKMLASYKGYLMEEGFTAEEAMELVKIEQQNFTKITGGRSDAD